MKKILFLLLVLSASCKKDEDNPLPVSKEARLEIEYSTLDTEMDIWYNVGNSLVDNTHKNTNYYKLDTQVRGDQEINVSITPTNGSLWSTILIKFNGDTVKYKTQMGGYSMTSHLPFIQ